MGIIGKPRQFHRKFKFVVEIDRLGSAAFQSCSELKAEISKIEYYEGGAIVPDKQPGRMSFSDITIERAATRDADLFKWFQETSNVLLQGGLENPLFKRNGSIVQHDRTGRVLRRWRLSGLWPMSFTGGAWDNTSDEYTMEQVVLALDYFVLDKNV